MVSCDLLNRLTCLQIWLVCALCRRTRGGINVKQSSPWGFHGSPHHISIYHWLASSLSSIGCWLLRPESKNHALIHKGGDTRRFTLWYILLSDNDYLPLLWSGRTNLVRHPGLGEHWGSHNVAWYPCWGEGGDVLTNRAHLLSALTHGPNSIHGIIQYMCAFVGGSPSLMMLRLVYMASYNMWTFVGGSRRAHLPAMLRTTDDKPLLHIDPAL